MARRLLDEAAERAILARVDARIAAAVESAPPLPDDIAARLVELIRASDDAQPAAA